MSKTVDFKKRWQKREDWETPDCSFCGSDKREHVLIYENVNNTLHNLVECSGCGLRFYSPRLRFDVLSKNSGNSENARAHADRYFLNTGFTPVEDRYLRRRQIKDFYQRTFQRVIDANGLPKSIFEVGGACGFFLDAVRDMGVEELCGCELNKWHVRNAKQKLGLENMWYGRFQDYHDMRQYDCGVMLDYIEHSYSPHQDLKKMSSMIRDGGSILLKTFLEELDVERTMAAPIGHATHFFGRVLRAMLESVGFEILDWFENGIMVTVVGRRIA